MNIFIFYDSLRFMKRKKLKKLSMKRNEFNGLVLLILYYEL